MTDTAAFQSFKTTHPDLWEQIGVAWLHAADDDHQLGIYQGLRLAVCTVGQFTVEEFDAEATREFDR